ncbi:MAG: acyl carrier protein [Eubacterium sp.]|nr:acyl carrier protein [Eubacterium sp.]
MDELLSLLSEIRPDVDFQNEEALIDDEILDSFDIISIVGEINDQFSIDINVNDLLPENFNTVDAMWELIQKLQNE